MPARRSFLLLLLFLPALAAATHPGDTAPPQQLSPEARHWVEKTMAAMTTDEKIGQIVFPTYFGAFESVESKDFKELQSRVENDHIGGFILATRRGPRGIELSHVYETAVLTNELQRAAKIPLLVGADFERGTVMRVEEGTAFPHAMAVGATGRPADAYAMGRITAIEARAMGVHWVFAPVADVNSNPDNPIINIRSFGEDPKQVAEYVSQFVRGVEENGAMATAKHFPGHGDTSVDSHMQLPLVTASRERLNAVEFVPFEAAIDAGVDSIMTAHLAVPALEPDPDIPATLSQRVLTGVLRDQLHFGGLVITDALDMGGVAKGFPPGEVAVRALLAGADVLLLSPVTDAALSSVRDAIQSGRVPMSRLDDAVRRLLEAKARLGLYKQREVDVDKLSSVFGKPEFLATAADIADRGVTLLRNDAGLVPLDPRTTKRVFLLAVSADPDTTPAEPFERELRAQLDSVDSLHVDTKYFRVAETQLPPPESYDLAICAMTVRVADRKGTIGLPADELEMIHALLKAGKPVIMVGLGSPYLMESFPEATTWLATFSVQDVAQRAAARALLGTFAVSGKLPVSLPGAAPHALHVADGLTTAAIPMKLQSASAATEGRLQKAYELVEKAAEEHLFDGAVLLVGYREQFAVLRAGETRARGDGKPDVVHPLDYLTAVDWPLWTTETAILVSQKQLTLDTAVWRVVPEFAEGPDAERKKAVTVRQLLEHSTWIPSGIAGTSPSERSDKPLAADPGTQYDPNGTGAILLQEVIRRLTGWSPQYFGDDRVFARLGVPVVYTTDCLDKAHTRCFPTGTPDQVGALLQLWLNGGIYAHHRFFPRAVGEAFLARKPLDGRALSAGWEFASEIAKPGRFISPHAYGSHGRFTSGFLWLDPENNLFVALIPHGGGPVQADSPARFQRLEHSVLDAVAEALGLASPH